MASEFFGNLSQLVEEEDRIDWSDYEEFKVLEPGWYDAVVDMSDAKKDKTPNGNRVLNFHVRVKADGKEHKVRARVFLTGGGRFLTEHLLRAVGVQDFRSITSTGQLIQATHGKPVRVLVKKEVSQQGNEFNTVNGYRAPSDASGEINVL